MRKHALPVLAIAALALAGCSASGNDDSSSEPSSGSSAPQTYDAPSDAWDNSGSPIATQEPEPFSLDDTVEFTEQEGATGNITFNATPPEDLAQGLSWAGKPSGSWAKIHVDNRKGSDSIGFSNMLVTLLDKDGNKYELKTDSSVAGNLYGDASSEDPHESDYADLMDKYDEGSAEIAAGEVKDMFLYVEKDLPQSIDRGNINLQATDVPLTIEK